MTIYDDVYFILPVDGIETVYKVGKEALDDCSIVTLPSKMFVQLFKIDDFMCTMPSPMYIFGESKVLDATRIFSLDECTQTYDNNWEDLLEIINAAAHFNIGITVRLPSEEHDRLAANTFEELDNLKNRMSMRAKDLIRLIEVIGKHYRAELVLCRTCS
ncbi:hypothetical protein ACFL0F_02190 [Patescibacteria group bacterium]